MKKNVLVVFGILGLTLAGCNFGGSASQASSAASDSGNVSASDSFSGDDVGQAGEKEIQFWHCIGHDKMRNLQRIIQKFNDDNKDSGYYVKAYQIAGSYDALNDAVKTKLNAGFVPSLTMGYPDSFAEYIGFNGAEKSNILNLDATIAADASFSASSFVEQFYKEGQSYQYSGTYSLPLYKSTEVMYYNKDLFQASAYYKAHKDETNARGAKLGDPSTWDWDTLVDVAKAIQEEKTGTPDFHALGYDSDANLFISQMAQRNIPYTTSEAKGGAHFTFFDTEKDAPNADLVDFATSVFDLTKSGALVTQGSYGSYASDLFLKKDVMFTIGSTGGSTYNEPNGAFQCGLAPVPCYQGNKKYIMQGPSLCFFDTKSAARQAKTWEFYSKYVSDDTLNAQLALENSYDPVKTASFDTTSYQDWCANGLDSSGNDDTTAQLQYRIPNLTKTLRTNYITSPVFIGSSTARTEIGSIIKYAREAGAGVDSKKAVSDAIIKAFDNCVNASTPNA
jgi:ABC-type glycerol-3-phosphate transport system substrate-binding protein